MKVNSEIFRAYDIRGTYKDQLSQELIFKIGQAIGSKVLLANSNKIYVGRDGRNSGEEISNLFIKGVLSTGCDVIYIGLVHTPLLYFATFEGETKNGVMITGSHNPKEYNGFKIVSNNISLKAEEIQDIKLKIEEENFITGNGKLSEESFDKAYEDAIASKIEIKNKIKVVLDCGNGSGSILGPKVLKTYSSELTELFCEVDGDFPNHHPDPTDESTLKILKNKMKEVDAELGIAFDGDGDRIGVVDKQGRPIPGDLLTAFLANSIATNDEIIQTIIFNGKFPITFCI